MREDPETTWLVDRIIEMAKNDPDLYDRQILQYEETLSDKDTMEAIQLANPGEDMRVQIRAGIKHIKTMHSLVIQAIAARDEGKREELQRLRAEIAANSDQSA